MGAGEVGQVGRQDVNFVSLLDPLLLGALVCPGDSQLLVSENQAWPRRTRCWAQRLCWVRAGTPGLQAIAGPVLSLWPSLTYGTARVSVESAWAALPGCVVWCPVDKDRDLMR